MRTQFRRYLPSIAASLAVVMGLEAEDKKSTSKASYGCMDLCYGGPNLECDENWEIGAAAVYEQVRVQGAEVAILSDAAARGAAIGVPSAGWGSGQVAYPVNATGVQQPEDFSWGFKLQLGYRNLFEGWRSAVRYNYFKAISNTSVLASYNFGFAPSQFINRSLFTIFRNTPGSFTTSVTGSVPLPYTVSSGLAPGNPSYTNVLFQNLQLGNSTIVNNLNFTVERPSLVTSSLEMTPFFGVSTTILTRRQVQVFTNDYSPTTSSGAITGGFYQSNLGCSFQNYQKYTWWGVGPLVGLHSSWVMGYNFSLFGDAYGALTYGQCSTRASTFSKRTTINQGGSGFDSNSYLPVEASLEQRMFQFSPEMDFNLGVRWEKIFSDDSMRARIQIGYESAFYFLVMKTVVNDMAYRVEDGAGLGLQGLVIEARLEF
jgi:hypothetical protein